MKAIEIKTTKKDKQMAGSVYRKIQDLLDDEKYQDKDVILLSIDSNQPLKIPTKAIKMFSLIIENMAEGKSNFLFTNDSELTTQKAAELLQVSRPYLIKLLEQGNLPFHTLGKHRRIKLEDLNNYKEKKKKETITQLQFLADQAQELNLDM